MVDKEVPELCWGDLAALRDYYLEDLQQLYSFLAFSYSKLRLNKERNAYKEEMRILYEVGVGCCGGCGRCWAA